MNIDVMFNNEKYTGDIKLLRLCYFLEEFKCLIGFLIRKM